MNMEGGRIGSKERGRKRKRAERRSGGGEKRKKVETTQKKQCHSDMTNSEREIDIHSLEI